MRHANVCVGRAVAGAVALTPWLVGAATDPLLRLKEEGADAFALGPREGKFTGKHGYPKAADRVIDDVTAANVDCVIVPGARCLCMCYESSLWCVTYCSAVWVPQVGGHRTTGAVTRALPGSSGIV